MKWKKLHSDIQYCFDTLIPEISVSVVVLQPVSVPESCWNRGHARLRADSLIRFQRRIAKNKETYMLGVTSIISTSVHGVDDLGILGLSFCPGHSSVVSIVRVNPQNMFYKVAVHELLHSFGLPHCKNKDRTCYMCDANGTPQLKKQTRLCDDCRAKLLNK